MYYALKTTFGLPAALLTAFLGLSPVAPPGEGGPRPAPPSEVRETSPLTVAQFRRGVEPLVEKGMTVAQLRVALRTDPIRGRDGVRWALADGVLLTVSLEGDEEAFITCWNVRPTP
jgi:hypothetical protein